MMAVFFVSLFWLIMSLICVSQPPVYDTKSSPVVDYRGIHSIAETTEEQLFYTYDFKYLTLVQATVLLRSVCDDCQWYLDHDRQRVGLLTTQSRWRTYRSSFRKVDRILPMIQLTVDVIEVSDTSNASYQHILSQLSQPIQLDAFDDISLALGFMVSSGNASLVSSPRVITKSGQESMISVGDKIPYSTSYTSNGSTVQNIKYIDSGIHLTITPFLHANHMIDLLVELDYKTVSGYRSDQRMDMPIFASRSAKMSIQVSSNATVVFAGLLDQSNHHVIEKVPILGDIPLIGRFFRQTIKKKRYADLIYKITPTLL